MPLGHDPIPHHLHRSHDGPISCQDPDPDLDLNVYSDLCDSSPLLSIHHFWTISTANALSSDDGRRGSRHAHDEVRGPSSRAGHPRDLPQLCGGECLVGSDLVDDHKGDQSNRFDNIIIN